MQYGCQRHIDLAGLEVSKDLNYSHPWDMKSSCINLRQRTQVRVQISSMGWGLVYTCMPSSALAAYR
jgi:hypothetical protein